MQQKPALRRTKQFNAQEPASEMTRAGLSVERGVDGMKRERTDRTATAFTTTGSPSKLTWEMQEHIAHVQLWPTKRTRQTEFKIPCDPLLTCSPFFCSTRARFAFSFCAARSVKKELCTFQTLALAGCL